MFLRDRGTRNARKMYDPFLSPNESSDRVANKLLSVRKTPFFQQRLTHLEWHSTELRKRPRNDFIPTAAPVHSHGQPNLRGHPSNNHDTKSNKAGAPDSHNKNISNIINKNSNNKNNNSNDNNGQNPNHSGHNHMNPTPSKPGENVRVIEKTVVYEPSTIMGNPPLVDDRVRHLVQFILQHVKEGNIEIEAKLGSLIEKDQSVRVIHLVPVICETPIRPESNSDVRFESDVGDKLFGKINERLNGRVEETSNRPKQTKLINPNLPSHINGGTVSYVRTQEADVYYPNRIRQTRRPSAASAAMNPQRPVYDQVVRTQRKTRLGDLNVLCPGSICDIRYSASREEDCEVPPTASPEMQREKYRLSYKYEYVSVDITTVEMVRGGKLKTTHEVEVEVDSAAVNLFEEVTKYLQGDESSKLFDVATSLVQTVRVLLEI